MLHWFGIDCFVCVRFMLEGWVYVMMTGEYIGLAGVWCILGQ